MTRLDEIGQRSKWTASQAYDDIAYLMRIARAAEALESAALVAERHLAMYQTPDSIEAKWLLWSASKQYRAALTDKSSDETALEGEA